MLQRLLYSPFLAQIVVTRRCNLACSYCNEYVTSGPDVPLDALLARARRLRELGAWALELSGGEPLLNPGACDLVAYAKHELRFYRVMLVSNAFLFDDDLVERMNRAGLDDLQVSVDGVQPSTETLKVLRTMRPKLERLARTARFRVTLNAVIGSTVPEEAIEVLRFARQMGFRPRACLLHDGSGQLRLTPTQTATFTRMRREFRGRLVESSDYRTQLSRGGSAPFKCRAGSRYLYVDEDGMVRWCSQQRTAWGIPLEQYDFDELKRQFHTPKSCSPSCTVGCVRTCSAYDGWRPQRLPVVEVPAEANFHVSAQALTERRQRSTSK